MGGDDLDRRAFDREWRENLIKSLNDNTRTIIELQKVMAVHCEGDILIKKELSEVRETVYGNGKPGIKEDVSNIKIAVAETEKTIVGLDGKGGVVGDVEGIKLNIASAKGWAIGASTIIGAAWAILNHFMNKKP